jgi:hypothetical protein
MYGGADKDHAEFLADISSFANTMGGDLVGYPSPQSAHYFAVYGRHVWLMFGPT